MAPLTPTSSRIPLGKLDGFFTLDAPGTKGVVGFAESQTCELGLVTISPRSRYAAVYVTAKEPDRDLERSKRVLVVAIARARNTGMKVLHDERILEPGKPPVVMEPVRARIILRKGGTPTVALLDHNGRRTAQTLAFQEALLRSTARGIAPAITWWSIPNPQISQPGAASSSCADTLPTLRLSVPAALGWEISRLKGIAPRSARCSTPVQAGRGPANRRAPMKTPRFKDDFDRS